MPRNSKNLRTAEKIKILDLAKRSLTAQEIGLAVGRHASSIWALFREHGVHPNIAHRQHDIIDARIAKLHGELGEQEAEIKVQAAVRAEYELMQPEPAARPARQDNIGLSAGLRALEALSALADKDVANILFELAVVLDELQKSR